MKKMICLVVLGVLLYACSKTTDINTVGLPGDSKESVSAKESIIEEGLSQDQVKCPITITTVGKTTVCKDGSCDFSTIAEALNSESQIIITDCNTYDEQLTIDRLNNLELDCQNAVIKGTEAEDIFVIKNSEDIIIKNCQLTGGKIAVNALVAKELEILNNEIYNNKQAARFKLSSDGAFMNNNVHDNSDDGLVVADASFHNTLKGNTFENNGGTGMVILSAPNAIENNVIKNNQRGGIKLQGSNSLIFENDISGNEQFGLSCTLVSEGNFQDNICDNCDGCPFDTCAEDGC